MHTAPDAKDCTTADSDRAPRGTPTAAADSVRTGAKALARRAASNAPPVRLTPALALQLQGVAGNAAVAALAARQRPSVRRERLDRDPAQSLPHDRRARVLARSGIEGSVLGTLDPMHEVITAMAIKTAREMIAVENLSPGSLLGDVAVDELPDWGSSTAHNLYARRLPPSMHQFIRGVMWADDPKGYLLDQQHNLNPSLGLMWLEEFDEDEAQDREALIARSHFGDLQFLHGMATHGRQNPAETKASMLRWARFLIEIASGRLDPDKKVSEHPLSAELFDAFADLTLKQLFGFKRGSDMAVRRRALGTLFHLIQDSYAKGHTERNEAGAIVEFHSYGEQAGDLHEHYDEWAPGATLSERFRNTHGVVSAWSMSALVAKAIDQRTPTDDIVQWLDTDVFTLADNVRASGPGLDFDKRRKTQIDPIGTTVRQASGFDGTYSKQWVRTTGVVWVQHSSGPVLVLAQTWSTESHLKFVRFIDHDMRDVALARGQQLQPRGIRLVPDVPSMIVGVPTEVPRTAARPASPLSIQATPTWREAQAAAAVAAAAAATAAAVAQAASDERYMAADPNKDVTYDVGYVEPEDVGP